MRGSRAHVGADGGGRGVRVGQQQDGLCGQRRAQRVEGLKGKRVVAIAAGMESSAALTENGEVYTW